jgi:hypothetical protein
MSLKLNTPSGGSVTLTVADTVEHTTQVVAGKEELAGSTGSSLVGYMPAVTGAVARTAQDKLRESVSVKDFGAVGDGVTDDTVAIQAAINSVTNTTFATTWPSGIKNYSKGGGVVVIPPGRYRITSGLLLGHHVRIQGSSTKGYYYPNTAETSGSLILADFVNPNDWVFSSANYDASGNRIGYRDGVTGAETDAGLWNYTHGIEIHDLTINAISPCYGGIRLNGSPNSVLSNISVLFTDVGYHVNCSWGVNAQRVFSITYLYGFAALADVNGLDLNGYFDGTPGKTVDSSNRLLSINTSDFGAGGGLPDLYNKKMGFVSFYTNTLNMSNVIVQHWEVACIIVNTKGYSNNAMYSEGNTDAVFATATSNGVVNGIFSYDPTLISDGYFFGLNSDVTLSGVPKFGYSGGGDTFSTVRIENTKPDIYGWKYSDAVNFLGAPTGIIRVSSSGVVNNIAYDTTYTTIDEALRRVQNSQIGKWRIIIKDGETVEIVDFHTISGKSISFEREGSGTNPTIRILSSGGSPRYITLAGDTALLFKSVNLAYTASTTPSDGSLSSGLFIGQAQASTIRLNFDYSTIDLQTGWRLLQQGYYSVSTVQASFISCTINGSSNACILGAAYANEAQTNVISRQHATTTSASIKALGTNGWFNANVMSSNF